MSSSIIQRHEVPQMNTDHPTNAVQYYHGCLGGSRVAARPLMRTYLKVRSISFAPCKAIGDVGACISEKCILNYSDNVELLPRQRA